MKPAGRFTNDELDELLARGRLSGNQYDSIEERVLERTRPERSKRWWFALAPATAAASLLGVWLVARAGSDDGFTEKGGGEPARAAIDVGCEGPRPHVCRLGETLMFSVGASERPGYLAAYAERVDVPAPRIWYFPARSGGQPRVEPAAATRVLGEGIRLGAPHVPGRYRVHAWISETPTARTDDADRDPGAVELALEIAD